MAFELTPRLRAVADRIPPKARLCDVGTDHAYLPVWLLLQDAIPSAIATDLRPGPLDRARETVERWGVEERISLRLCDGLTGVSAGEADAISIAGMGGETILHILQDAPWAREKPCVVQPMSSLTDLRLGLDQLQMHIAREILVPEGTTLYVVMELAPGSDGPLTPAEAWAGTLRSHTGDPLWPRYLAREHARAKKAVSGLERSHRPEDVPRLAWLREVLEGLDDFKKRGEDL